MPKRINTENAQIELMRNSEILLDGYPMALVQSLQDDLQQSDQTIDVYGAGSQITYKIVDGATLNVTVVSDPASSVLYDVATGQNPATADQAMRGYFPNERVRMDLLRNFRNPEGDGYDAVVLYTNWDGIIRMPQGGPKEHGQIRMDGRAKVPIEIRAPRFTKFAGLGNVVPLVAAADGSFAVGFTAFDPTELPAMPPLRGVPTFALALEIQAGDGRARGVAVNASKRLVVTAANVTAKPQDEPAEALLTDQAGAVPGTINVDDTTGFPEAGFLALDTGEAEEIVGYTGITADAFTGVTRAMLGTTELELAEGDFATAIPCNVRITEDEAAQVGMTLSGAILPGQKTVATRAFVQYVFTPEAGEGAGTQGGRCLLGDGIPFDGRYD